jgi:tetratricopeptide (TPR) repeat protein
MKPPIFFLFLFQLISFQLIAQDLKGKYTKLSEQEIKERAIESLDNWNYFMRNNLDSLKIDAFEILFLGLENKSNFAINVGKRSLGSYLIRTGETDKGLTYLKSSNSYFEERQDYLIQTEVLNELGNGYLYAGKPVLAEKFFLKSLKCGKNSPDPTSAFLAEANLAQAYINLQNYDKAEAYLQHYKKECIKNGKLESVANAYASLGQIALIRKKRALAKEYFQKSAGFGFKSKSKALIAHAYNNLAIAHFEEGKTDSSIALFQKALELRLKIKNAKSICESYYNIGGLYVELKQFDKALEYYTFCENYSKSNNLLKEEMDVNLAISEMYKLQMNFEKALVYSERYADLLEKYYSELAFDHTENQDNFHLLEEMERENGNENYESKMNEQFMNQKYQTYLLYVAMILFVLALIFLTIYRQKNQLSRGG